VIGNAERRSRPRAARLRIRHVFRHAQTLVDVDLRSPLPFVKKLQHGGHRHERRTTENLINEMPWSSANRFLTCSVTSVLVHFVSDARPQNPIRGDDAETSIRQESYNTEGTDTNGDPRNI
jgi:hypothetical protein